MCGTWTSEDVHYPKHLFGKLVADSGEKIKEVRTNSQADVFLQKGDDYTEVRIAGTAEHVQAAKAMLAAVAQGVTYDRLGREMCGRFQRGDCLRGDQCRYSHGAGRGTRSRERRQELRRSRRAAGAAGAAEPPQEPQGLQEPQERE